MIKKQFMRAAGLAMAVVFAAPAFAANVATTNNLTDILVKKGVISSDEAKSIKKDKNGKLELKGLLYADAETSKTRNVAAPAAPLGTASKTKGLQIGRFYLDVRYHINDTWMARFTTDVNNETPGVPGLKRHMNVYLKYAYMEGHFSDALQLRFGLSHTPWIDYEQGLWQHRYAAKVTSDWFGYDSSSDYGVGVKGKVANDMVEYWLTATNGGGYGNPNMTNGIDYNGRITVHPVKGMDISGQYRTGFNGSKTFTGGVNTAGVKHNFWQGLIAYYADLGNNSDFRVGANYMQNKNQATLQKDKSVAVWGFVRMDKFGAYARYDDDKRTVGATNAKDKRYVAGLEYFPVQKGIRYSLQWTGLDYKIQGTKTDTIGIYSQYEW